MREDIAHGSYPGCDSKFVVDSAQVGFDGRDAEHQALGDFVIRGAFGKQQQHLKFARRQFGGDGGLRLWLMLISASRKHGQRLVRIQAAPGVPLCDECRRTELLAHLRYQPGAALRLDRNTMDPGRLAVALTARLSLRHVRLLGGRPHVLLFPS